MTDAQRKHLYFPIWSETAKRLDWRMSNGRLVADLTEQCQGSFLWPDHAGIALRGVLAAGQALAMRDRRAPVADDLRHGCNWMASAWPADGSQTYSSSSFGQRQMNQFDRLCAVLREPWDLTATVAWLNPAEDDRKRSLKYVRKLTYEARLIAIAKNAWGHSDLDSLNQGQIDWLISQVVSNGRGKFARHAGQPF